MGKYKVRTLLLVLIIGLATIFPQVSFSWSGECVGIVDGDTIRVLKDDQEVRIRLYGIDCPENRQAFSKKARQFTADMVFRKIVEIEPVTVDRYKRTVAWVSVDGKSLNKELVKAGFAWWFKKYAPAAHELESMEKQAKDARVGLWSGSNPTPPWEFRDQKKNKK